MVGINFGFACQSLIRLEGRRDERRTSNVQHRILNDAIYYLLIYLCASAPLRDIFFETRAKPPRRQEKFTTEVTEKHRDFL
jgi:hypothetical protein